jgi:hypothetical protein
MFSSEAEKIYQSWATRDKKATVSPEGRASGKFDQLLTHGGAFGDVATKLVALKASKGSVAAAEQAWKLLEKFKRRQSETVAVEVLKSWKRNDEMRALLAQFPASMFPDLSDDARAVAEKLDFRNLTFPRTGKRVRILKVLGKGGVGGVVMLGEDQNGVKYAVKHLPVAGHKDPGHGMSPNVAHLNRTQAHLMQYFEASVTTTCVDMIRVGADQLLLLQLGEGTVNYSTLSLSDVIAVFQDLETCYNYGKNYMNVDVTQDVAVLHLDIHGENLMRFNGRLRLIDFGMALVHNPSQGEGWRDATPKPYDRNNEQLYYQVDSVVEDHKRYEDHTRGKWKEYITKWQQAYRVPPDVIVCQGCQRQYPSGMKLTECFRCGSKKLVSAKLRQADVKGLANLKGVSPASIGDAPYAGRSVSSVNAQQYGCVVLTAVLIKEIWAATEGTKGDLGMGKRAARSVLNEEAYPLARQGLHKFKAAAGESSGLVELLLLWYDEMMFRLFDNEKFGPEDAVRFFGGGRTTKASRERRHSVAF